MPKRRRKQAGMREREAQGFTFPHPQPKSDAEVMANFAAKFAVAEVEAWRIHRAEKAARERRAGTS